MFTANFVASVRIRGKTMREFKGDGTRTIYLPFGSDYSLHFKNLDTRRVSFSVEIDGENVSGGTTIVLDGNSEMELQGALGKNSNSVHNSFRFIEKTDKIREHRGEHAEDGIVRIEFQHADPPRPVAPPPPYIPPISPFYPWRPWHPGFPPRRISFYNHQPEENVYSCNSAEIRSAGILRSANEDGITVPGAECHQQFGETCFHSSQPKHVICFELKGETTDNRPVKQPITSRQKQKCVTCGMTNKSGSRFCRECATALV